MRRGGLKPNTHQTLRSAPRLNASSGGFAFRWGCFELCPPSLSTMFLLEAASIVLRVIATFCLVGIFAWICVLIYERGLFAFDGAALKGIVFLGLSTYAYFFMAKRLEKGESKRGIMIACALISLYSLIPLFSGDWRQIALILPHVYFVVATMMNYKEPQTVVGESQVE